MVQPVMWPCHMPHLHKHIYASDSIYISSSDVYLKKTLATLHLESYQIICIVDIQKSVTLYSNNILLLSQFRKDTVPDND